MAKKYSKIINAAKYTFSCTSSYTCSKCDSVTAINNRKPGFRRFVGYHDYHAASSKFFQNGSEPVAGLFICHQHSNSIIHLPNAESVKIENPIDKVCQSCW